MVDNDVPAVTPKLRFPEFGGKNTWANVTLYEILKEHKMKSDGKAAVHSVSVHKGVVNQIEHLGRSFAAADTSKYNLLKPYDVVYTRSPTGDFPYGIIKQNTLPYNVLVSPLYGVFTPQNRYIGYILDAHFESSIRTSNYLASITQKGAKNTIQISNTTFLSKALPLPIDAQEQQKIADCLTSLDELIAAQGRKVEALKAHKKGLMQQLFPREGETVPRLRFPQFRNAPKWTRGVIGNIAMVLQGYGFPERYQGQASGEFPFYKVSDISNSLGRGDLFIKESANYVDVDLVQTIRAKPIPKGTTIFAKIGEAIRSNKRVITTCPCLIDNNAAGAKSLSGKSTDLFVYFIIETVSLIDHAGGVVPAVNKSAIEKIPIAYPPITEQASLSKCISSMDVRITHEIKKLRVLKTHKIGLMQQLFPDI